MPNTMTDAEVDKMENLLREAQGKVEEAGRIVCSHGGEYAAHAWSRCTSTAEDIGDIIHFLFRLRPDE